jgi:hypothetical protein
MSQHIARGVKQAAEASRIVESQGLATIEQYVDVVVGEPRRSRRQHAQAAGHAEVQHERRAIIESEKQVLRAPPRTPHLAPHHSCGQIGSHGPAQARFVNRERDDAPLEHIRLDTATRRFDFWELGHLARGLLDLGFFVADVLAHDGIVLLRLHLLWMETLVLHRDIEVAGARG